MKFICEWKFRDREAIQLVNKKSQEENEPLDGIKYLAKWYTGTGRGYSLLETEDPMALNKLLVFWADLLEMNTVPVVEEKNLPGA